MVTTRRAAAARRLVTSTTPAQDSGAPHSQNGRTDERREDHRPRVHQLRTRGRARCTELPVRLQAGQPAVRRPVRRVDDGRPHRVRRHPRTAPGGVVSAPEGEVAAAVRRGADRMAGTYLLPKPSDAERLASVRAEIDAIDAVYDHAKDGL